MLRVGLYGGIGSGKSTAAKIFAQLGVSIIDADLIARELITPNSPQLKKIKHTFGDSIVQDGSLNRARLRKIIASNAHAREQLNAIMHPAIRQQLEARVAQLEGAYCLIVIPLLLESQMLDLVDRIIVMDCSEQKQLKRVIQRDKVSADEVKKLIKSQANRSRRLEIADLVLDNSADLLHLEKQILSLHKNLIEELDS